MSTESWLSPAVSDTFLYNTQSYSLQSHHLSRYITETVRRVLERHQGLLRLCPDPGILALVELLAERLQSDDLLQGGNVEIISSRCWEFG